MSTGVVRKSKEWFGASRFRAPPPTEPCEIELLPAGGNNLRLYVGTALQTARIAALDFGDVHVDMSHFKVSGRDLLMAPATGPSAPGQRPRTVLVVEMIELPWSTVHINEGDPIEVETVADGPARVILHGQSAASDPINFADVFEQTMSRTRSR